MTPSRKTDLARRRSTARRIAYFHPETGLPYITEQESRKRTQRQTDLNYLNDLFGLDLPLLSDLSPHALP